MSTIRYIVTMSVMTGLLVYFAAAPASAEDYAHKITYKDFQFDWTVKGDSIAIQISAPTTGWVGIGFNPSEKMKGANFIVGYVKDGKPEVSDEFGKTDRTHENDAKEGGTDNVTDVTGTEANGKTTLSFTIPLNSGDPKDKALNVNGDTTVLLAYSEGRDSFKTRHKVHYALSVNLSTGAFTEYHKH